MARETSSSCVSGSTPSAPLHLHLTSHQVGQGTVDLGDVTLDALFDKIYPICHTSGQCEQNEISTDGWWLEGGTDADEEPITVTMKPSGEYPTWIHNGLLDILKASVKEVANCRKVVNVAVDKPGGTRTEAIQCLVPSFWGINYQADGDAAPPNIGITVTARENTEESPCKTALETIGGLAGKFTCDLLCTEGNAHVSYRGCVWSCWRGFLSPYAHLPSLIANVERLQRHLCEKPEA